MLYFPDDSSVTGLARRLADAFELVQQPVGTLRRSFLDSFDWRLFEAGLELECRAMGETVELRLRQREEPFESRTVSLACCPERAVDFGEGLLGARLRQILGYRVLQPMGTTQFRCLRASLVNSDGKLLARLELLTVSRRRGVSARIDGITGYEKAARRLQRRLCRDFGAIKTTWDAFSEATAACIPAPGGYPRWRAALGIDAEERTDVAVRRALRHYSTIMDLNIEGARAAVDPEFLHEFRIGLRRCRTLLRRIPGVLPTTRRNAFARDFAWLSMETSSVRDLDVHILEFPHFAGVINAADEKALTPLFEQQLMQQQRAHERLTRVLGGARFRRRWEAWQRMLKTPSPSSPSCPAALVPVRETARHGIARVARKAYKQGDRLSEVSPAEDYHELRKILKNLRYLSDVYAEIVPRKHFKRMLRLLKALQDELGEHQDLEVHATILRGFARSLAEGSSLPEHTRSVVDRLATELTQRSKAARASVAGLYAPLRAMKLHKHPFGR